MGSLLTGALEGAVGTLTFGADVALLPSDLMMSIIDDNYKYNRFDSASPFPRTSEFYAYWDNSPVKKAIKQTFDVKDNVLNEVVEEIGTFLGPLKGVDKVSKEQIRT